MPSLQELEADAQLQVPREIGRAIKALFADANHRVAVQFIVEQLCGRHRLSFVPSNPQAHDTMLWREGRRFVGETLTRIAEAPMEEETPPEPPARTMTERAERRARNSKTT